MPMKLFPISNLNFNMRLNLLFTTLCATVEEHRRSTNDNIGLYFHDKCNTDFAENLGDKFSILMKYGSSKFGCLVYDKAT